VINTICKIATLNAALVFSLALAGANEIAPRAPAPKGQIAIESSILLAGNPTCERAQKTIASEGFKEIQTIDCTGQFYVFTAWRLDSFYIIKVSAQSGRIVMAEPQRLKPLWDQ
jgi:hypothetical protein